MLITRNFTINDESFVVSVLTNQVWSSIKGKKPTKDWTRVYCKELFYEYLYGDRLDVKVISLEDDEKIIIAFSIVLDTCLITTFIKSDFTDKEVKDRIAFMLLKGISKVDSYCFDIVKEFLEVDRLNRNVLYWGKR